LDIQLLNAHCARLLEGRRFEKPVYSCQGGVSHGTKPVTLEANTDFVARLFAWAVSADHGSIPASAQFRVYIENLSVLVEGDGSTSGECRSGRPAVAGGCARREHRNHSPTGRCCTGFTLRAGECVQHRAVERRGGCGGDGGFHSSLAALRPFFAESGGMLPTEADNCRTSRFVDARIPVQPPAPFFLLDSVQDFEAGELRRLGLFRAMPWCGEFIGGNTISDST